MKNVGLTLRIYQGIKGKTPFRRTNSVRNIAKQGTHGLSWDNLRVTTSQPLGPVSPNLMLL